MDIPQLGAFVREHFTDHPEPVGRTAFRLETLDLYDVDSDDSDFERYVAGEPEPARPGLSVWLERIRAERSRGLRRSRVNLLEPPLSDYQRFECEWGYVLNVEAGEDVRILDLSEVALPSGVRELFTATGDFWLLNDEHVARMEYDDRGRFVGAEPITGDISIYHQASRAAWSAGAPFGEWWARHPEHHRKV